MFSKAKIKKWIPWLWLAMCFGALCLFMHYQFPKILDGDMSSSSLIAAWNLSKESGLAKFMSPNWYYSTEVMILDTQLVYMPLFLIFEDWHVVRLLGTIIQYILLLLSYYFFCSQANIKRSFPISASFLLLPFSDVHFSLVLMGTFHYTFYLMALFVMAGLYVGFATKADLSRRSYSLRMISLCLLSFLTGLTGLRMILLFHLPAVALAVMMYSASRCGWKRLNLLTAKQSGKLLVSSVIAIVFALVGDLFNAGVLPKYFSFANYHSLSLLDFNIDRVWEFINDLFFCFGYETYKSAFSSALAGALLCLCLTLLAVVCICRSFKRHEQLPANPHKSIITLLWVFSLGFFAAVLALTDVLYWWGTLAPVVPLLIPIIAAWFLEDHEWKLSWKTAIAGVVACAVVASSGYQYLKFSTDQTYELRMITDVLLQEGYTEGYSAFWQGTPITEFSDGQIEIRVWEDDDEYKEMMDVDSIYRWLQAKSHETTKPVGKTFVLFSKFYNQHNTFSLGRWLRPEDVLMDTTDYLVYGYDSYEELLHSVDQHVHATFADGRWYAQNYQRQGDTALAPDAQTQGLNIPLYPGSYTVTVNGQGLSALTSRFAHASGTLDAQTVQATDEQLVFHVETADLLHGLDLHLQNGSSQTAHIHSLTIEKRSDIP